MTQNVSNQQGYSIHERAGGHDFSFTTAYGIEYLVYFTEADGYVPSASFASEIRMLGFTPLTGTFDADKRLPNDPQVWIAIFEILYLYVVRQPDVILLYVCSDESVWNPGPDHRHTRYAKTRSDVFTKRYQQWQQTDVLPAEKVDFTLYDQLYCSCVFRTGNPHEAELRQIIEQTLLTKQ